MCVGFRNQKAGEPVGEPGQNFLFDFEKDGEVRV